MLRIALIFLFLGLCVIIPFVYYDLVKVLVANLHTGWVFATIFLRFICIVFFAIALNLTFSLFEKTKRIKFIVVFLISLLPGFGISFIAPIYENDYGDFSDSLTLDTVDLLSFSTNGEYSPEEERHIVAFFSTDCGHCQNASRKLAINKKAGQEIDIHAFFMEDQDVINAFMDDHGSEDFNAYRVDNSQFFMTVSGFEFPSIFLIDRDKSTIKHYAGDVMNYTTLDYLADIEP